ncbi:ATP-binding protein [Antrihabitans stalactiti]|nr:ATP-binding protein [Antrihabitans stalactiti]
MTPAVVATPAARKVAVRATEHVTRSLAATIGLGGVAYALLDAPEIYHQSTLIEGWWTPLTVVAMYGTGLAMAYAALRKSLRSVRRLAATMAIAFVVCNALHPLATEYGALDGQAAWLWRTSTIGAVAAALVWRPAAAIGYTVFAVAVASLANAHGLGQSDIFDYVQYFVRGLGSSTVFAWVVISALTATALLDSESSIAERSAVIAAAAEARARERARFAALIHDGVLSTLLDASRGRESTVLSAQAERTLREINEFRSTTTARNTFDAAAAIGFLRAAALAVNNKIVFSARRQAGFDDLRLPVAAAEALAAAVTEAIRNSLRHADEPGRTVLRRVGVAVGAGGIRVEISDDGRGFDPAQVPSHRLGVALSILGRMRELPGGAAFVESAPGVGTKVTLVWGSTGDR